MTVNRLVVLIPDAVGHDGTFVSVNTKTLDGVLAYRERWPGEVVLAARTGAWRSDAMQSVVRRADVPFDMELYDDIGLLQSRQGSTVTLAMHLVDNAQLLKYDARRVVFYGEFPLSERIIAARLRSRGVATLRAELGWRRRGNLLRRMVRESGGFQANGYPAWNEYAALSPDSILYFDTRVRSDHVRDRANEKEASSRELRLAFSGRHILEKGPAFAVEATLEVLDAGHNVTLDIFGTGEQTGMLKSAARRAGDQIRFFGAIPFDPDWTEHVRSQVDLMVLPHVQGDPSGTYLEAAALKVPVIGFDNSALSELVERHGIGWTVPIGDAGALAAKIGSLIGAHEELGAAGVAGRQMMNSRTMEQEFLRRVQHLRSVGDV